MVRGAPQASARAISQLLHGEGFAVLEQRGGWAWGYCEHDQYVGYVPVEALGALATPSHVVDVPEALTFEAADIKATVSATLSLGSRVTGAEEGRFLKTALGYIHMRHVRPIGHLDRDPVAVAEKLIGAPYLWGGRGADGVDCSGLVQLALELCGIACPRDSDQQLAQLGADVDTAAPPMRGDLVFFPGHVGFMDDETHLLHANAHWMAVVKEPLDDVIGRLSDHATPVLGRKRLRS